MIPNDVHVILLCGEKGVGKDYIGNILEKEYGYTTIAFADPMKTFFDLIFTWCDSSSVTPETKECPVDHPLNATKASYRDLWIEFGRFCNTIEPGVFIRHVENWIAQISEETGQKRFVITDMRTELEHMWSVNNDYDLIKINNPMNRYRSNQGIAFESYIKTVETQWVIENRDGVDPRPQIDMLAIEEGVI